MEIQENNEPQCYIGIINTLLHYYTQRYVPCARKCPLRRAINSGKRPGFRLAINVIMAHQIHEEPLLQFV